MFEKHGHVVTPVYIERTPNKLEHLGSGVLVQFKEGYFIFTAAHVLAEKVNGNILLPGKPNFFGPSGTTISSCQLLPEVAHKDSVDLSYLRLTDDEVLKLRVSGAKFLPVTNDNLEPTGSTPFPGVGAVSGYPSASVTISGQISEVHFTDLVEMDFASPERLRKAGFNSETTIGLIRPKKLWLDGQRLRDLDLEGMSGGAIWAHDKGHVRLVGIFTEYRSSRSLLIGTRLKPLITEMARRTRLG